MILITKGTMSATTDRQQAQKPVPPVYHLHEAFDRANTAFKNYQEVVSRIPNNNWDPLGPETKYDDRGHVPIPSPPIELLERGLAMLENTFQAYKTTMERSDRQVDVPRQQFSATAPPLSSNKKPVGPRNRPALPVRREPIITPQFKETASTATEGPSSIGDPVLPQPSRSKATSKSLSLSTGTVIAPKAKPVSRKSVPPTPLEPAAQNPPVNPRPDITRKKSGAKAKAGEKSGTKVRAGLRAPLPSDAAAAAQGAGPAGVQSKPPPFISPFLQNTDNVPSISPHPNPPNTPHTSSYADITTHHSPYTNPHDTNSDGRTKEDSATAPGTRMEAEGSTRAGLNALFPKGAPNERQRARPAKRAGEEHEEGKRRAETHSLYRRPW